MSLKSSIKTLLGNAGYDLHRHAGEPIRDAFSEQKRLTQLSHPVIFDVGANIGNTCYHYNQLFRNATLHAFEPFPASFDRLRERMAGINNAFLHSFGLANENEDKAFSSNVSPGTNSLFNASQDSEKIWGKELLAKKEEMILPFRRLDDFVEEHKIPRIDILKIDVQGAELLVLRGGEKTLKAGRIRLIYVELLVAPTYDGQPPLYQILEYLHTHNFFLFNLFNLATHDGRLRQMDAIFLHGK